MTTLQNSCIEVIALNFERYFLKFSDTEDAVLKRKFEFLQRKYSYDMVSLLYREGRMKTQYIDFFINKHLKVLDFDWLMGYSWDQIVAKFKEVGPGLQELVFGSDHHEMPHFTDLLKICVSVCPHLKSLTCPIVKQENLKILSDLSALEKLNLDNVSRSDKFHINEMLELNGKKLHSLSISYVSLSVFSLSNSCQVLKHLLLKEIKLNSDGVSSLVFPCLEECILDCLLDNMDSLESICLLLKSSPKLESIGIESICMSKLQAEILKCCVEKPIKKINLSGPVAEITFIKDILCNCHSLTSITLYYYDFQDELELNSIARLLPNTPEIIFLNKDINEVSDDEYDQYDYHDFLDQDNYDDDE